MPISPEKTHEVCLAIRDMNNGEIQSFIMDCAVALAIRTGKTPPEVLSDISEEAFGEMDWDAIKRNLRGLVHS